MPRVETPPHPFDQAALSLVASRVSAARFDRLSESTRPKGPEAAYAIQDRVHLLLAEYGYGSRVGFKIGCTTPVMQAYLGIDTPCEGSVFSSTFHYGYGEFSSRGERRLGVECEIAVTLGRDLEGPATRSALAAAVDSYHASLEVVEDRYVDYPALDTWTLVSDDFFHAGLVLGPAVRGFDPDELTSVAGRMLIDGVEVGNGLGSAILGHPLEALGWLAEQRASRGEGLRAGDVVTLGSLVQTHWVEPGQRVVVECEPLGTAVARFVAPASTGDKR